jgi:hypothetical protein
MNIRVPILSREAKAGRGGICLLTDGHDRKTFLQMETRTTSLPPTYGIASFDIGSRSRLQSKWSRQDYRVS